MIGRRVVVAALVLACWWPMATASAGTTSTGPTVGHQVDSGTTDLLQVTSVSPWVQADGDFQVRFAPSAAVPLNSVFSYTVHQRIRPTGKTSLRAALEDVLDGGALPGVLQAPVSAPVITLGNPAQGMVLDVPVRTSRGTSDRVLLPTAGIHPVDLRLDDASGQELWHTVVFLNRLPEDPVTSAGGVPARMSVTLALPVDGPPALAADGRADPDAATKAAVDGATTLLTEVPDAPLVLALRPNVLSAVTRSEDPRDRRFLQALTGSGTVAVPARTPYAAVDTGGLLAAGAGDELVRQVELGDRVITDTTRKQPTVGTWYLDDTVSPESLGVLKILGASRVVLSSDRLRLGSGIPPEVATTMAVGLQGESAMTATASDTQVSFRLTAAAVAPAQRANQAISELLSTWFAAAERPSTSFPGPSSVIVISPTTDPDVLRSLVPALTSGGPLSSDPADVPTKAALRNGRPVIATLAPRTPPDQRAAVSQTRVTRNLIDGYRSMAPTAVAETANWEVLNGETMAKDMPADERSDIHARIDADIQRRAAAIQLPRSRRVVLTSRASTIPLRFRNDLTVDVHLIMRTRSVRLEITGGDTREIVLKPGENRIDLPVVVRASGGSLLRIDLRSPDGAIRLPPTNLPVTASTISGVGAALSVISLAFLALWWIRTTRRRRRQDARSDGGHPSATPTPGDPDPDPDPADSGTGPTPAAVGTPSRPEGGTADSVDPGG